jgi:hypothetical protein
VRRSLLGVRLEILEEIKLRRSSSADPVVLDGPQPDVDRAVVEIEDRSLGRYIPSRGARRPYIRSAVAIAIAAVFALAAMLLALAKGPHGGSDNRLAAIVPTSIVPTSIVPPGVWTEGASVRLSGFSHPIVAGDSSLVLTNGNDGRYLLQKYDRSTGAWSAPRPTPVEVRGSYALIASPAGFLIWGGRRTSGPLTNGFIYSLADDAWHEMSPSPLSATYEAAGAWSGSDYIIWGPATERDIAQRNPVLGTTMQNEGAAYDPVTDKWRLLPSQGLEQARFTRAAVRIAATSRQIVLLARAPSAVVETYVLDRSAQSWQQGWPLTALRAEPLIGLGTAANAFYAVVGPRTHPAEPSSVYIMDNDRSWREISPATGLPTACMLGTSFSELLPLMCPPSDWWTIGNGAMERINADQPPEWGAGALGDELLTLLLEQIGPDNSRVLRLFILPR